MGIFPKSWGMYPPEYNREIHGPYNPGTYYGKRDIPFGDVKLGELPSWFGRRRKTPSAVIQAISRAWFRYNLTWISPKRPGSAFIFQLSLFTILFNFAIDPIRYTEEYYYRYH